MDGGGGGALEGAMSMRGYLAKHLVTTDLHLTFSTRTAPVAAAGAIAASASMLFLSFFFLSFFFFFFFFRMKSTITRGQPRFLPLFFSRYKIIARPTTSRVGLGWDGASAPV